MRTSILVIIFLIANLVMSCEDENSRINGYWVIQDSNIKGLGFLYVDNNVVIIEDCLHKHTSGIVKNDHEFQFKTGLDINTLTYQVINDSILKLEGLSYQLTDYDYENDFIEEFDLLGLDSDVIFPSKSLNDGRWLQIKLRDASKEFPLILGERKSRLDELRLFAPRTICSNARPKVIDYEFVIIQIEKGASVSDLMNIEQQLYFEHRVNSFVIITDELSFNNYQSVIDHKYISSSLDETIHKEMTEYLKVRWPPYPVFPYESTFEEEVKELNLIKIDSYYDFLNSTDVKFSRSLHNLVVISDAMKIEEYLEILRHIQEVRLLKGCKISTHLLNYI